MQYVDGVRRFIEQPLMIVLGMLTGAGAAKTGHGEWAAGGVVALVAIYAGAAATAMATRSLAAWVVRMRRREVLALAARQPQRSGPGERDGSHRRHHALGGVRTLDFSVGVKRPAIRIRRAIKR